jgi:hypothetical protein
MNGERRLAAVPPAANGFGERVTKTTLLEVAYHLALRLQGEGDETAAVTILLEEAAILGKPVRPPSKRTWISPWAHALGDVFNANRGKL